MSAPLRLSRAAYLAGLQCERRLWLADRDAGPRDSGTRSVEVVLAQGHELRRLARQLFPGGRGVDAADFADAVKRTRALCADPGVPAIFDAALARDPVALRVDVLERLGDARWRLCEVVPGSRAAEPDLDAAALALFAARGSGLDVASVQVLHVDAGYRRPAGAIDGRACFARQDVTAEAELLLEDVSAQAERFARALSSPAEPKREPSPHCRRPWPCEFRARCMGDLPADWIDGLPGLRPSRFHAMREAGIARISEIPDAWPLPGPQALARAAHRGAGLARSTYLRAALAKLGPPTDYLDFEAIAPAVPIYPGTRPFQQLPVAWSLHRREGPGELEHTEFLAVGSEDPRRELAERLLEALDAPRHPILVYSPFESQVLSDLALEHPDLAPALETLRAQLHDLQPVVRRGVYHVAFGGSLSLKRVASALCPGFGYADLEQIADGRAAADAFERIARRELAADEERRARAALRTYCARDTEALAALHAALIVLDRD